MADFDEMLASLRHQKEKLRSELAEVEKAIEFFERAKRELHPDLFAKLEFGPVNTTAPIQRTHSALSPHDIALAARDVLFDNGRPMKRGAIVTELAKRGIVLGGKDPNKNLGTILWRNSRIFVPLEGLGYWVKGIRLPGVYEPDAE